MHHCFKARGFKACPRPHAATVRGHAAAGQGRRAPAGHGNTGTAWAFALAWPAASAGAVGFAPGFLRAYRLVSLAGFAFANC
jgi:hypothetical protein